MIVYRISKTRNAADLTGEGSSLHGGRWNNKSIACIYGSENRALALLEYTVNVALHEVPLHLSLITLQIQDVPVLELREEDLPDNWKEVPAPSSTKDFGTDRLNISSPLILKIPSILLPQEFNLVINAPALQSGLCKIRGLTEFTYDTRIKR